MQRAMVAVVGVLAAASAQAQVTTSFGAGSAVSVVQAAADFESQNALFDNPYVENGLRFTRTDLTFNNNSCGFAGCPGHPGFVGFTGNYMYGVGSGYFSLLAPVGQSFQGLELVPGTGFGTTTTTVIYEAFLGGVAVGTGTVVANVTDVLGFSRLAGFDELRYTNEGGAPAFDTVRAQFTGGVAAVPEPGTYALLATGLAVLGGVARRRRAAAA